MRLIAFYLLAFVAAASAEDVPTGRWEGSAQVPGRVLRIVLDLDRNDAGWNGAISLPDLGVRGAGLTDLAFNAGELTCALKGALADQRTGPAKLKAQLRGDGSLAGEFVQAGNTAPFTLVKAGPAQFETPRKSTSIARELEGEWKGGYELFGYPRKVTLKLQNRGRAGRRRGFRHRREEGEHAACRPGYSGRLVPFRYLH